MGNDTSWVDGYSHTYQVGGTNQVFATMRLFNRSSVMLPLGRCISCTLSPDQLPLSFRGDVSLGHPDRLHVVASKIDNHLGSIVFQVP